MNILIEAGDLNPPFAEGTRNIVRTYASELIRRGHKVVVLTKNKETLTQKTFKKEEIYEGLHYYRWANPIDLLLTFRKIKKKEKIDIVHIFAKGLRPIPYLTFLRWIKKPIIFTLTGYPFQTKYREKNFPRFIKRVDKITITSRTIFEKLKEYDSKKIAYLPYGIDTTLFCPKKKQKRTKKIILNIRTPTEEFISSYIKFNKDFPSLLILNSKNIEAHPEVKKFIPRSGTEIKYLKNIPNISNAINQADLLIDLEKTKKGYLVSASPPLVLSEAMACETKVLSLNIPEINELIKDGENGFLIKESSEKEIYEGIKKALISKKDVEKNGRKTILQNFDIKKVVKEYEEIYKRTTVF